MTTAARIAEVLAGHKVTARGGNYLVPCPAHDDANPSLSIRDGKHGGIVAYCFAGCPADAVLNALHRRGLLPQRAPNSKRGPLGLWEQSVDPRGTIVEGYLAKRGLPLPPGAREVLRFHRDCPFGGERTPAMIALVRNIASNEPQAIHRTALDQVGRKVEIDGKSKMALGPIGGGAIKLTADENVTIALGIAEGIETALSLQRLPEWEGSPAWSLISAGGVRKFPLLGGIETLVIAVDHDKAGEDSAREATRRWREAGRDVLLLQANTSNADLNDVL
jgi:putative DNA primase/helicase